MIMTMKQNTIYHIYEGVALLVTGLCWWFLLNPSPHVVAHHWQSLSHTLESINLDAQAASEEGIFNLREDTRRSGDSQYGLAIVKRTQLLMKRTNQLVAKLEEAKGFLQQLDPKECITTQRFMIRSGLAYQLKSELDGYTQWLQNEFEDLKLPQFASLAEGNQENPLYYASEPDKDFAHNYFESTSASKAIALINQKQAEVRRYGMMVFRRFWDDRGGSICGGHDGVEVQIRQLNMAIPVGEEYTADLFIGQPFYEAYPKITFNGHPLVVSSNMAEVNFLAQKVGKQFWESKVTYRHKGRCHMMTHKIPLEVLPRE